MALEVRPVVPLGQEDLPLTKGIASRVSLKIGNVACFEEATLRKVVTPRVEIDQEAKSVCLVSRGLSLTQERLTPGEEAILVEVAARYRRGEGAIKQLYRYLVFLENNTLYCQRLPMGAWAPADPDICLEWLGRGGRQQGDFVLLPRKRLPLAAEEIARPARQSRLRRAVEAFQQFLSEAFLDDDSYRGEWERLIGRHDPVDCRLYKKDSRLYLVAPHDTVSNHPEHAQLKIPQGTYEVVEDRASSYWRRAID